MSAKTGLNTAHSRSFCKRAVTALGLAVVLCLAAGAVSVDGGGIAIHAYALTIEYDNLRGLVEAGNPDLKFNSYYTSLGNVGHELKVLKEECQNMAGLGRLYKDNEEYASYSRTAETLNTSIKRLEKQLEKLTGENASINKTIDMLTMSAQTSMIAYLQAETKASAMEKQAAAAEVKYRNTLTRQTAGAATDAEVLAAHASMLSAESSAASLRQQADTLRGSFFRLLGVSDDGTVTVADVPIPDLAAIAALDPETDREAAINNDSQVQSVRHSRSQSSAEMTLKTESEDIAVAAAVNDYEESYTQLQARVEEYQAAVGAMSAAEQTWQGAQRRRSIGMLTEADALTAESQYFTAQSEFKTAQMNLKSAWDNYNWMVKGIA